MSNFSEIDLLSCLSFWKHKKKIVAKLLRLQISHICFLMFKVFKWKYNYITRFCLLQVLKKDICFGVQTATEFLVMPLVLHSVLSFSVVEYSLEMGLILLRKRKTSGWLAITKISRDELGPFLHACLHIVSFVCLFFYLHVFACVLLPLLLILLLLSLLLLFCCRFVVNALLSVLRWNYKMGHRKSFWYSPFLIQFFAHDYDSTTDEM